MKDRISPDTTRSVERAHLVIPEWLLNFLTSGNEAQVYEGRDADTRNGIPAKQIY